MGFSIIEIMLPVILASQCVDFSVLSPCLMFSLEFQTEFHQQLILTKYLNKYITHLQALHLWADTLNPRVWLLTPPLFAIFHHTLAGMLNMCQK